MNKNILHIPSLTYFGNDWNVLQNFLKHRGNPPFHIDGDLYLEGTSIQSLGNLKSVGGDLNLYDTQIESLGNLTSVGGYLGLSYSKIESLGNLTSVGGSLILLNTPISKTMTEDEIRSQVNVEGNIYFK